MTQSLPFRNSQSKEERLSTRKLKCRVLCTEMDGVLQRHDGGGGSILRVGENIRGCDL